MRRRLQALEAETESLQSRLDILSGKLGGMLTEQKDIGRRLKRLGDDLTNLQMETYAKDDGVGR